MDPIGWFIATTHQILGHDKTAAFINMPSGDKTLCILCRYEAAPSEVNRRAVIDAIGMAHGSPFIH